MTGSRDDPYPGHDSGHPDQLEGGRDDAQQQRAATTKAGELATTGDAIDTGPRLKLAYKDSIPVALPMPIKISQWSPAGCQISGASRTHNHRLIPSTPTKLMASRELRGPVARPDTRAMKFDVPQQAALAKPQKSGFMLPLLP